MSDALLPSLLGALVALVASPYLAALTCTVPDRAVVRWWRGGRPSRLVRLATAGAGAGLGALAGRAAGWGAVWPAFVLLALVATPLAVIDAQCHRLPHRLILTGSAFALVSLTLAAATTGAWPRLVRAAAAAVLVYGVGWLILLINKSWIGEGDVNLSALLAAHLGWLGWGVVLYGFYGGVVLGAVVALALLATRRARWRSAVAYGPSLIVGALLVAAAHPGF